MKKILITGGSGFIGKNLIEQLRDDYEIIAPTHKELNLQERHDTYNYIRSHQPDVLIHAATIGGKRNQRPDQLFINNTRIFHNVIAANDYVGQFIQLGSGAEYDKTIMPPKVMEEDFGGFYNMEDEYGLYKFMCSKYLEYVDNSVVLRIFGCYGKYEDPSVRFISSNLLRLLGGHPMSIDNQNINFDYLYVNDLAQIIKYFIEHKPKHKAYNVTPDHSSSLTDIADVIRGVVERDVPICIGKPGMGREYSGDNSRLRDEIKSLKLTSLHSGIRQLYNYYWELYAYENNATKSQYMSTHL